MRDVFCKALVEAAGKPDFVFLTGDLGFRALEPLRHALATRFINAGIAEQNMVSVAAGLARGGMRPWVYSIAPFLYARPFEQIRNDVCLHNLPVILVGNGGGYAYGVMGATHHALEDYGVLLGLPELRAYVPAFDGDVISLVDRLMRSDSPAYLRLGLSEQPNEMPLPPYAPWRRLLAGHGPTLVVVGPLVGGIVSAARQLDELRRPTIWLLSEFPLPDCPPELLDDIQRSGHLAVVEEHVAQGGAGQMLARQLLLQGAAPPNFTHCAARGYLSGRYGSQRFHRTECGLDPTSVLAQIGVGKTS